MYFPSILNNLRAIFNFGLWLICCLAIMHPFEVACCTTTIWEDSLHGFRHIIWTVSLLKLDYLRGTLFWKAAMVSVTQHQHWWIGTFLSVPSFSFHVSWRQSWQGTECLLLLWNQGRTRLEKWAAEVNRIMFAHLPTHPGIYSLPVSISLSASSGLEVGWGREASSNGRCFKTVPGFPESLMRSSHFQIGGHEYEVIPLPNRQKDLSNVQKNPSLSKAWIFFLLKEGFLRWG